MYFPEDELADISRVDPTRKAKSQHQLFFSAQENHSPVPLSHAQSRARWLNLVGFKHCVDFAGVFRDEDYIAFVMGLAEARTFSVELPLLPLPADCY